MQKKGAIPIADVPNFFLEIPLKTYIFQFGRFPHLSAAEISARLPHSEKKEEVCPGFFRYEGETMENEQELLDSLGGSIRIAEEYGEGKGKESTLEAVTQVLDEMFPEGKIQFGISVFRHNPSLQKYFQIGVKKALKKKERSSRCVNRGLQNLDGGTLHKEGFFTKKNRAEVLLFVQKNGGIVVGITRAAQNVEGFAERDYKKPERDMVVGMLPPKVALMLVNLSAKNGKLPDQLWDPFCGTGTIPVEAARLGIHVRGTDVSPKMVDAAQKNFLHILQKEGEFFVHDATKPVLMTQREFDMIGIKNPIKATAIATEGFLGPLFGRPVNEAEYMRAIKAVEPIMTGFLRMIEKEKSVEKIVLSLPFWKLHNGKLGFCKNTLAATKKIWKNALAPTKDGHEGLLYRRDDQVVGRQILVLERR